MTTATDDQEDLIEALDNELRGQVLGFDATVERVFEGAFTLVDGIEPISLREGTRKLVILHRQSAQLAGRRAIYALTNGADLNATGSLLTVELLKRVRQLRRARKELRKRERELGRLTRSSESQVEATFEDESIAEIVRQADAAIDGFEALMANTEGLLHRVDRAQYVQLIVLVARPTIAFHSIRIVAFTVTAALLTKLVSLPFAFLGWGGVIVGAIVAYLLVQLLLTPLLRQRFEVRLRREVMRLAHSVLATLAHSALVDEMIAVTRSAIKNTRIARTRQGKERVTASPGDRAARRGR